MRADIARWLGYPLNNQERVINKVPLVIVIAGDKGGTGKSTVTRTVLDYARQQHANARVIDCEVPAGETSRYESGAEIIDPDTPQGQMRIFDELPPVTIIDAAARQLSPFVRALHTTHLDDDVRAGSLRIALLHLISPSDRSIREIAEIAASLGGGAKHFLVKNHINSASFQEWEADCHFAATFQKMEAFTVTVPNLNSAATDVMQRLGMGFAAFARDLDQSRILRGYVRSWLDIVFREFDRIGLSDMISAAAA
jgi:hypothetical protein